MSHIRNWSVQKKRQKIVQRLRSLYETLAGQLFEQYEPSRIAAKPLSRRFLDRVERWLNEFPDDESKWTAFCSIQYLFFAGQAEFDEMYRYAADEILKRWLIDQAGIDIFSKDAEREIAAELDLCWPCPITDSLRINGFLHVTGVKGRSIRPDWGSLRVLGSEEAIQKFTQDAKKPVKYLVLLEDFVGSGNQIDKILEYAEKVFQGPILVIPLIICATGNRVLTARADCSNGKITYRPVVVIPEDCLIGPNPVAGEPKLFKQLRPTLAAGYKKINKNMSGGEFGYELTGSLVVLYSNCPNNTPPIFHASTKSWKPLFPRSSRG